MKLFEYQAKEAFRDKGLPTPKGVLVRGMDELDGAFAEVGFPCVLKSQVLRGGRGKAGLIKVVKDAESAKATAKTLFESEHNVRMLLVEEAVDIDREIYLSITVDPVESKIMLIGCAEGGVEIEKLAATAPEKIVTVRVDIAEGLGGYHVNNLIYGMGLSGDLGKQVGAVVRGLYKTFRAYDAQLAEINPLFITRDGKAIAGDGKLIIDDNSVWRQPHYPLTRDYFDSEVEFEAICRAFYEILLGRDGLFQPDQTQSSRVVRADGGVYRCALCLPPLCRCPAGGVPRVSEGAGELSART